jgi:glycosyltransferase involved in cell wall biosynthesis
MTEVPSLPKVVTHVISGDLWAGAEVQIYQLCKGLIEEATVTPTAVVFNEGLLSARLRDLGMAVDVADEARLGPLQIIKAIRHHCEQYHSQVVHTHGFKENVLGIIAKDLAGVPVSVRTVHGNPETQFALTTLHKWLVKQLDLALGRYRQHRVIAVSTQLELRLEKLFPGKVEKIFNFVDVEAIRAQWPVSRRERTGECCLAIVGRLVPVKRVDLFLETVAQLNREGIPCTGRVIGTGPMEHSLKQLAHDLGIAERIDFTCFLDPVSEALSGVDVLLMTSDHEGLPMTLLEALSLEIPIVAHNTGGIPEVLDDGSCGWLVGDHSAQGYASSIREALGAPEETARKLAAGLNRVRSEFALNRNTRKYVELYQR